MTKFTSNKIIQISNFKNGLIIMLLCRDCKSIEISLALIYSLRLENGVRPDDAETLVINFDS